MKRLCRALREPGERGAALALVGSALLLLLGMAAFGSDLAWFYLNGARIQRAADAAALGGVVHLPSAESTAKTNAQSIAVQNGYTNGANAVVDPQVDSDDPVLGPTELRVTISADVETFFLRAFGWDTQTITQTATAEYVPPLPLGSPSNQFGDSPGCWPSGSPTGPCNNFWASIQGHYNGRGYGDYYSSRCLSWSNCSFNTDHRDRGYLYGVDVPAGVTQFVVELLNPGYTGPNPMEERTVSPYSARPEPSIDFVLYDETPTPLVLGSTSVITGCSQSYAPGPWDPGVTWQALCTVSSAIEGIYPLQVRIPPGSSHAHARYSIRARATAGSGADPSVYALEDMSIYTATQGVTEFYLAEVEPFHKGNTLIIELWDAGDASNQSPTLQVVGAEGQLFNCQFSSTNPSHSPILPGCAKTTSFQGDTVDDCFNCFNNDWMTFRIELPQDYDCTDCWWKMRYTYPGGTGSDVRDTTTWRAFIEGNPIHLVPNP